MEERICCAIAMMFGCFIFALLIGTLSTVMMGQKLLEEKVDRQMAELREFLVEQKIPVRSRSTALHHPTRVDVGHHLSSFILLPNSR